MDPYIERRALWADFHDSLVAAIRGALQPRLRPKYAALVQDRLYVVESRRPIIPDVGVLKHRRAQRAPRNGGLAVLEAEQPIVFEIVEEEIRQPYVEIVETRTGNRLTTAIEVLSPDNKHAGVGRKMHMKKRSELRRARVNVVEIDLLRAGTTTLSLPPDALEELPPWHYLIGVLRRPKQQAVYAVDLRQPLPVIGVPLGADDPDVPLDLQAAFARVWEEGPYPEMLDYAAAPPGAMAETELKWCAARLREAGFRK
jgi:hypothetical protein